MPTERGQGRLVVTSEVDEVAVVSEGEDLDAPEATAPRRVDKLIRISLHQGA